MIDFIHNTIIYVSDVDAAIDFYVNTLGWELTADQPFGPGDRWVTVRPVGSQTALSLSKSTDPRPEMTFTGISLIATDIDGFYAQASAKGVQFAGPVETMPWGAKGVAFSDPDGNGFYVNDTP